GHRAVRARRRDALAARAGAARGGAPGDGARDLRRVARVAARRHPHRSARPMSDIRSESPDRSGELARRGPPAGVADIDFEQAPFIVIWETTRACDLACMHCRAEAVPRRHPLELDTRAARRLMDDVRRFGRPLFVLTGGDPLKRPDIVELVEYGASIGLRMAMTPSGTPLMKPAVLRRLRDAGLARLAVSLDGSSARIHD